MSPDSAKPVSLWSREEKVLEAIKRSFPYLDDHTVEILKSMITPQAIAVAVGVLGVWAASHFVGVGEIADIILLVVGVAALGFSAVTAAEHLYKFADKSLNAATEKDLDEAGVHFSKAVTLIGVEAIAAILFKARPKGTLKSNYFAGPVNIHNPPPAGITKGLFYKPTMRRDPTLRAGEGYTTWWGDIYFSPHGTRVDRALAIRHEKVHQFLTAKFVLLRELRVKFTAEVYNKSHLLRYLEEAWAEGIAQFGVHGFRSAFKGVVFPVRSVNGQPAYVTIAEMTSEAGGILLGPINIGGAVYRVWLHQSDPTLKSKRQ